MIQLRLEYIVLDVSEASDLLPFLQLIYLETSNLLFGLAYDRAADADKLSSRIL